MQELNAFFWNLRRGIQNFESLDSELYSRIGLGDLEYIGEVLRAKKIVKRILSEEITIHIGSDQVLAEKIKKIRDDYGYNIDCFIDNISYMSGISVSQSSEDDKDFVDALFSDGTADYVDEKFFQRKNEIGAIVCSQCLPDILKGNIYRLKECYSLGLFEATVIYCRAVIESCAFIFLSKKGMIVNNNRVTDIGEYSLNDLLNRVKPFIKPSMHKEVKDLVLLANKVLHEKRNVISIQCNNAYASIKTTFEFIESLFK